MLLEGIDKPCRFRAVRVHGGLPEEDKKAGQTEYDEHEGINWRWMSMGVISVDRISCVCASIRICSLLH